MHYKGCVFHRVVTAYLCQSGDIKCGNGTWSQSIFSHNNPEAKFADENVILRHAGPGVLSMVNEGPDSNGSGFYIDFVENERVRYYMLPAAIMPVMKLSYLVSFLSIGSLQLNDKNVVFGVVCSEDSIAVLFEMERQGSLSGKPRETIMIADCGQLYP